MPARAHTRRCVPVDDTHAHQPPQPNEATANIFSGSRRPVHAVGHGRERLPAVAARGRPPKARAHVDLGERRGREKERGDALNGKKERGDALNGKAVKKEDSISTKMSMRARQVRAEKYLAVLRQEMRGGGACQECGRLGRIGPLYNFEKCFDEGHLMVPQDGQPITPCDVCPQEQCKGVDLYIQLCVLTTTRPHERTHVRTHARARAHTHTHTHREAWSTSGLALARVAQVGGNEQMLRLLRISVQARASWHGIDAFTPACALYTHATHRVACVQAHGCMGDAEQRVLLQACGSFSSATGRGISQDCTAAKHRALSCTRIQRSAPKPPPVELPEHLPQPTPQPQILREGEGDPRNPSPCMCSMLNSLRVTQHPKASSAPFHKNYHLCRLRPRVARESAPEVPMRSPLARIMVLSGGPRMRKGRGPRVSEDLVMAPACREAMMPPSTVWRWRRQMREAGN